MNAAIRAQYLPAGIDPAKWLPIILTRADTRYFALCILPAGVFADTGVTQLARHDDVYATILWITYLLAMLLALGVPYLRTSTAGPQLAGR